MNIYSIHSHKGGVGKTTFSLFFSKYLAQIKKEKTCLIDLDFQARGLRSTYLRENLTHDLSDFILADEKKKKEIVGQLPVKYEKIDNLYFIANLFKPHKAIQDQLDILKKIYIKVVNEIYTGEIMDNLDELLKHLKEKGFKNIIIDDHPGLVLLSEELIKQVNTTPIFITTPNIVSFVGLFKNLMDRAAAWGLKLNEIKIIINHAPVNFSLRDFYEALDVFIDSKEASHAERLVCQLIKKQFVDRKNGLMLIAENEAIRQLETIITPRTLLSMDLPEDLKNVVEKIHPH
jgi:cellulose biosynthesis protein BcsQ